jgi:predicted transcriptional regulator
MSFRGIHMPEEISILCLLHNIGAINSDKSMTIEEISVWIAMESEKVKEYLEKLISNNYISMDVYEGNRRYYVTKEGIRKVLTMYS